MPDRKSPPPFVKSTSFELIKPDLHKLPNGIDLLFVPGGSQDVIKVEVILRAGRWFEEFRGAAQFVGNLLNKGTRSKSSFQIAQIFDQYGNGDMFVNSVDWSAEQEDIASITPKTPTARTFTPPNQIQWIAILLGSVLVIPGLEHRACNSSLSGPMRVGQG